MEAEAAVAALAGPAKTAKPPVSTSPETIAAIERRLEALAARWRALDDGGEIRLSFSQP
jgi:hypothetical protein